MPTELFANGAKLSPDIKLTTPLELIWGSQRTTDPQGKPLVVRGSLDTTPLAVTLQQPLGFDQTFFRLEKKSKGFQLRVVVVEEINDDEGNQTFKPVVEFVVKDLVPVKRSINLVEGQHELKGETFTPFLERYFPPSPEK